MSVVELRSEADAETIMLSAIAKAQDEGRPQLAEMIETIDNEIERSKTSTRIWLMQGADCASPEWARKIVGLASVKRLLMLIAQNERGVAAVLQKKREGDGS